VPAGVLPNIPFPRQSPLSQLRIEIAGRARVKGVGIQAEFESTRGWGEGGVTAARFVTREMLHPRGNKSYNLLRHVLSPE